MFFWRLRLDTLYLIERKTFDWILRAFAHHPSPSLWSGRARGEMLELERGKMRFDKNMYFHVVLEWNWIYMSILWFTHWTIDLDLIQRRMWQEVPWRSRDWEEPRNRSMPGQRCGRSELERKSHLVSLWGANLHDGNKYEGALPRPFVEFEETFSQASQKGTHLFLRFAAFQWIRYLGCCKRKSNHPNPGHFFYLEEGNRPIGGFSFFKWPWPVTSLSSSHCSE